MNGLHSKSPTSIPKGTKMRFRTRKANALPDSARECSQGRGQVTRHYWLGADVTTVGYRATSLDVAIEYQHMHATPIYPRAEG